MEKIVHRVEDRNRVEKIRTRVVEDLETKNGMSSKLKYNLEDKIAKKKVGKGIKRILTQLRTIF